MRIAFAAIALVVLAACPNQDRNRDESTTGPPKTTTATGNPQTIPENSTAMNPVAAPQAANKGNRPAEAAAPAVHVQLTEYAIEMPDTLTAGTHSFTITNAGTMKHNFAIEGPGVKEKLASDLMRGDTAPMTLTLQKGSYMVYCPVDGHRGRGMQRTITVQ
jgi:uncharacterized cupredoxin-like copper-binding protein